MKKKIAVTGSTKLAGVIVERFGAIPHRVDADIDYHNTDVLINNAHVDFEQCYILENAFNHWRDDATKQIINISSRAGLSNISKGYMYAAQKAALDHMADNLTYNSNKQCKITTINLGMLNDELPSVGYGEVCDLIEYILNLPQHLEIPRVFLQHAHNYQDIQQQKATRYEAK